MIENVKRHIVPLLILALSGLLAAIQVSAQGVNLTQQQRQQFQNLSDEQRRQLLGQLNQQPGSGAGSQQPVENPDVVVPRDAGDSRQRAQPQQMPEALSPGQYDQYADQPPFLVDPVTSLPQAPRRDRLIIEQQPQLADQVLEPFGYDLFAGTPTTFAPATTIPVPSTYIIGPGDTVTLQLYGQRNLTYDLVVTREGQLMFPEIGPVNVSGLTFDEMRAQLQTIVSNQLIGQNASITMGPLRSIDVFVLGEAWRPGSYTVSSLSTMTNALFVSGGVTDVGSLRAIRLMRAGVQVTELDLYDLLLRGDTSGDARLQPGDVIFVPPVGRTVSVAGEVRRPAIYEIKNEVSATEVLALSGGLTPTAYPAASRIERINAQGERTLIDVDLSAQSPALADGDYIEIASVMDQLESVVMLAGHVQRPGGFQWRDGLRVSDVLPSVARMLPNPDLDYALVARELLPSRRIELVYVNLGAAISAPGSAQDVMLQPRDRLLTFGTSEDRRRQLVSLLDRLYDQASFDAPPLVVNVTGAVRFPGEYPLVQGMTLGAAIRFAGGLEADAALDSVLLERRVAQRPEIIVERHALDEQDLTSPTALKPLDKVIVFSADEPRAGLLADTLEKLRVQATTDRPTEVVSVTGQVRFPGNYPLTPGLSVADLVTLAGGFDESADVIRAEVTRFTVLPQGGRALRHVDVDLQGGRDFGLSRFDQLVIRQMPNWTDNETVTLRGEVNSPGTYSITKRDTLSSLIARAGGLTDFADPRAAVFLRAALRENEERVLEKYTQQLQEDAAAQQLQEGDTGASLEETQRLLESVAATEATGRLVINLPRILAGRGEGIDPELRDGDELMIPRIAQEVTVLGEIRQPTSHLFDEALTVADYIGRSGGYTEDALTRGVYVIRASGEVVPFGGARWFFQARSRVEPGDSIVVPFEPERPDQLTIWTSVSQILFNISTTLLAIERVGN